MERELAIKIENVKKQYRLGAIGGGTLQGDLQSWWAKLRGKEDPNSKIGQKTYSGNERFYALNGISFDVYKGERLGIIGGNGAGKSTTLKLLSRVTAPTEGTIYINGRISSMLEVGTGFHPELTGRENIYLNGAILGMSKAEVDSKIEDIIDFSECRQFIDTPVKRYSSGMYVKLAFAVAAHLDSEILIMDEVLAVGDMAFQKKCIKKMSEVAENEGRTVLYVSHNMNTIRQLCDRCIVLNHGKVIFNGDVEDAINIYMNQSKDECAFKEYMDYVRPNWLNQKLNLISANYLNKSDIIFADDDKIQLQLKWEALNDLEEIGLRIEVWTLDDIPQATFIMYNICNCKNDERVECVIEMDIKQIVDADYKTYYTFFQKDDLGNNVDIECVPGLSIKKVNLNQDNAMHWNAKQWGYIKLPTPHLIEIKSDKAEKK